MTDKNHRPKMLAALAAASAFALNACSPAPTGDASQSGENAAPADNQTALTAILAGEHRSVEERARDAYRHPVETLEFFDVQPNMTVIEIWPGGGWYTQIIAPYLKSGGGKYYAASFPTEGASERTLDALARFKQTYVAKPEIYGDIDMTALGGNHHVAPTSSADVVLTFRNVHNWRNNGAAQEYFNEFYRALKPGGVLGVVEHRADGAAQQQDGSSGYVYEDEVKALASAAGFDFETSSEINANPADTKDHPFGVWTLPPTRRSSAIRGEEDAAFDRAAFDAIGESDRMTLKFRKPIAADGALLE